MNLNTKSLINELLDTIYQLKKKEARYERLYGIFMQENHLVKEIGEEKENGDYIIKEVIIKPYALEKIRNIFRS